jgi:V8-like Glu-specific endopeptidase
MRGRILLTMIITAVTVVWPLASAGSAADAPGWSGAVAAGRQAPAVGALFTTDSGRLGLHFCTASVVDSPAGDLVITAAHCLAGYPDTDPPGLVFVPGYDRGAAPYGVWTVTRVFVDAAWARSGSSADDDVAFLTVTRPGGAPVEAVTGGEVLGTGRAAGERVRVTGYPDAGDQPVSCASRVTGFGAGQLEFDCDGYTDGTSGSPFLVRGGAAGGRADLVIGVIGGYQQGGDSADVSYSAAFGPPVAALYDRAVAGS